MDLLANARKFFSSKLAIPAEVVKGLEVESISRVAQARRSRIRGEVVVVFVNPDSRDIAQSYASNLAAHKGEAGLRMELPNHLRGFLSTLRCTEEL